MPESTNPAGPAWEPRLVWPGALVGINQAAERYGVNRSTLVRRIEAGQVVPLAGPADGIAAYVFDVSDLPRLP